MPRFMDAVTLKRVDRLRLDFGCFIREVLLGPDHPPGTGGWDRSETSSCSASYMFDDKKSGGNPGRIIYSGSAENDQQHFPDEAPTL